MKKLTIKNRYMVWTGIWIILFTGTLALLPHYYWFAVPAILWAMVGAGFVKDVWDMYLINRLEEPFLHPYFEHMPLMVIIAVYSMYSLVSTEEWAWALLAVAALAEAYFDWYQDKLVLQK